MAAKLVIEPIFEADFQENSYGFRPKRNAHQAVDDITHHLNKGYTQVIDADISKYFDTIPHDKLLKLVTKRIVDKHMLEGIKRTANHLGLSLNEKKTRVVEAREGFNFLGFNIKVVKNPKTGKTFPLTRPSKKSMKHIRALSDERDRNRYVLMKMGIGQT